jgi:hypothetical protein
MSFRVIRQDDNGIRFVLAEGLSKIQADDLSAEAEKRATGHKQMFLVENNEDVCRWFGTVSECRKVPCPHWKLP